MANKRFGTAPIGDTRVNDAAAKALAFGTFGTDSRLLFGTYAPEDRVQELLATNNNSFTIAQQADDYKLALQQNLKRDAVTQPMLTMTRAYVAPVVKGILDIVPQLLDVGGSLGELLPGQSKVGGAGARKVSQT